MISSLSSALGSPYVNLERVLEDLTTAGYLDAYVIRLADSRTVYVAAISPSGMRIRLESLEDVAAALSTGEQS